MMVDDVSQSDISQNQVSQSDISQNQVSQMRVEYDSKRMEISDLNANPVEQFESWLDFAIAERQTEPNAMVLSTVDENTMPHSRCVLLKDYSNEGYTFFTNYGSDKSKQIETNANVSLLFAWLDVSRQVRISGTAVRCADVISDSYWYSRSREAQLGSAASVQSSECASYDDLLAHYCDLDKKYDNEVIPRPNWGGWSVQPETFEFWSGGASRLHHRFFYEKDTNSQWQIKRLQP